MVEELNSFDFINERININSKGIVDFKVTIQEHFQNLQVLFFKAINDIFSQLQIALHEKFECHLKRFNVKTLRRFLLFDFYLGV